MMCFSEFENPWALLKLTVLDKDELTSDDLQGIAVIPVEEIPHDQPVQREYELINPNSKGKENGHIIVTLQLFAATSNAYPINVSGLSLD
jgi:hypothetical protein